MGVTPGTDAAPAAEGGPPAAGDGQQRVLTIGGEEAHHANRVKRINAGDRVEVLDGLGTVASCQVIEIGKRRGELVMSLQVLTARAAAEPNPRVAVASAIPKGDRLNWLIEQLSQVGASSWRALRTERGSTDVDAPNPEKLRRIAREAGKQCGRPWLLEIDGPMTLPEALKTQVGRTTLVADASGGLGLPGAGGAEMPGELLLLVGPEGGWSDAERALIAGADARIVGLGAHTLRIETACVVGAAVLGLRG